MIIGTFGRSTCYVSVSTVRSLRPQKEASILRPRPVLHHRRRSSRSSRRPPRRPRLVSTVRAGSRRRHRRRELVPEPARVREPRDRPKRDQLQFLAQTVRRAVEVGREPARELDVGADQRAERDGGPERASPRREGRGGPERRRAFAAERHHRLAVVPPGRAASWLSCENVPSRLCAAARNEGARDASRAASIRRSNASTLASISRNVRSNTASASSANGDDGTPGTPREAARNGSSNADAGSSPRRGAARGTIGAAARRRASPGSRPDIPPGRAGPDLATRRPRARDTRPGRERDYRRDVHRTLLFAVEPTSRLYLAHSAPSGGQARVRSDECRPFPERCGKRKMPSAKFARHLSL